MHRRGRPEEKYVVPAYTDVVEEVRRFLVERAEACQGAGIARDRIALDPGLGFGKNVEENMALIAGAARLADAGYPVLIGASRKSFIGRLTGIAEPRRRDPASVWLAVEAAAQEAAPSPAAQMSGWVWCRKVRESMSTSPWLSAAARPEAVTQSGPRNGGTRWSMS